MKKIYLNIHDNNKTNNIERGAISWEYYDIFSNIFDSNRSVAIVTVITEQRGNKSRYTGIQIYCHLLIEQVLNLQI